MSKGFGKFGKFGKYGGKFGSMSAGVALCEMFVLQYIIGSLTARHAEFGKFGKFGFD